MYNTNLNKGMHDTQLKYCIICHYKENKKTSNYTTINGNMQHCSIQLQREVKSNPKTAQLYKKCAAPEKAIVNKGGKSKVAAKNGCNGRLIENF